jgi:hypothetical protein
MNERLARIEGRDTVDAFLTQNRQMINQASTMADQKASIILGLQVFVLTFILSEFAGFGNSGGGDGPEKSFSWWLLPLAVCTFASIVCSLVVLMPATGRWWSRWLRGEPPEAGPPNLLFFASIAQVSEARFLDEMGALLESDGRIYEAILIDIHRESKVLYGKKYRLLRHAFRIFLGGIGLSLLCFLFTMR